MNVVSILFEFNIKTVFAQCLKTRFYVYIQYSYVYFN